MRESEKLPVRRATHLLQRQLQGAQTRKMTQILHKLC